MASGKTLLGAVLEVVVDRLASQKVLNFFRQSKFDQFFIHKLQVLMFAAEKLLLDAEQKLMTDSVSNCGLRSSSIGSTEWRKLPTRLPQRLCNHLWKESCLLYTSPSPRDGLLSRMPSSA